MTLLGQVQKQWAVVKGEWIRGYTGTGQFIPRSVVIVNSEEEGNKILSDAHATRCSEWYLVPVEEQE